MWGAGSPTPGEVGRLKSPHPIRAMPFLPDFSLRGAWGWAHRGTPEQLDTVCVWGLTLSMLGPRGGGLLEGDLQWEALMDS